MANLSLKNPGRVAGKIFLIILSLMLTMTSGFASENLSKILITNVHIFDGINNERLMNANLLVEGN
jgi:hypothetical protein